MKHSNALMTTSCTAIRGNVKDTDTLIALLFAAFAAAQILSWRFPWLAVTGRLSTSPIVVVLCFAGIAAVRMKDWRLAKQVSFAAVPVLAAGRFTVHILGGAPPFTGWNLFEVRCISELFILIIIAVLCFRQPSDSTGRRVFIMMMLGFLTDAFDTPFFSLKKIRESELILCVISAALWIFGGCWGGFPMLSAVLLVPWAMMISGERNNKNLVGVILAMKLIADLNETAYLHNQNLYILFIVLDCMAVLMAFLGRREEFSLVLMIEIMAIFAGFMIFCCASVDRSAPYFLKNAAAWCSELALYSSHALKGYGKGWSKQSLGTVLNWITELDEECPDDVWEPAQTGGGIYGYRVRKAILYLAVLIIAVLSISTVAGTYVSSTDVRSDNSGNVLKWSEDRTVAAHYDIFREALYGTESELTYEKRLEFFEAAVDVESNYLCIPYAISVRTDKLSKGEDTKTAANFNFSRQTITVDEDYLAEADPWDLLETAAHETFHAWQYEAVLLDKVVKDERSRAFLYDQLASVEEYKKEFSDYKDEGLAYYGQTVEREARRYAADSVISTKERMQDLAENRE